jgi:RND family efflux transporter MFP subunit
LKQFVGKFGGPGLVPSDIYAAWFLHPFGFAGRPLAHPSGLLRQAARDGHPMNRHAPALLRFILFLAACVGPTGCARSPGEGTAPTPPPVTVSYPLQGEVTDYVYFTGQTAAVNAVQIRARVSGYLEKINFKEGAEVKQDDVLFEIDPRPYQFTLEQAQAQVRLQEATLKYQESVYARNVRLLNAGQAVSPEDVQQSLSQRDATRASLQNAGANVKQAELNLAFTKVTAPVSGRIGRDLVTRGNLIIADQTMLTTIMSQDPMYAYFDVDEPTMLRIQQLIRAGKFKSAREEGANVPVELGLSIEPDYPHQGLVDFVNNQVNPSTGTLQVRGTFPNPKPPVGGRFLSPGLFVRIRVPVGPPYAALLIAQSAIASDQNLRYVYVVDEENKVARRDVQLGSEQGTLQVITKGLGPKDRVVVNGLLHVRPGSVVNAHLEPMPTTEVPAGPPPLPTTGANGPTPNPTPPATPTHRQGASPTQTRH